MSDLALWTLESDLVDLMNMREEAATDSEREVIDQQIALYLRSEIRKVDGIRAYWKHCEMLRDAAKAEATAMQQRAAAWSAKLDRLKSGIQSVMESMPWAEGKSRKLEGMTGAVLLKTNGGKQAVTITDESLVPADLKTVTVKMSFDQWMKLGIPAFKNTDVDISHPIADAARVSAELNKACAACYGSGVVVFVSDNGHEEVEDRQQCEVCGGSGKQGVPGARLEPRGAHVELK